MTDRLVENFSHLLDYSFTADMERELDQIAVGEREWRGVLNTFYQDFSKRMTAAGADDGMRPNLPTSTDIDCDTCGRPMQVRTASTGVFLGCSGYALPPAERCTRTLNLVPGEEAVAADADDEEESRRLRAKRRCPQCDAVMDAYLIDETRKLHLCGNNPTATATRWSAASSVSRATRGRFWPARNAGPRCSCRAAASANTSRCTGDGCGNTRKLLRNGQAAPRGPRRCPCRSFAAAPWTTTTCCATAPRAFFWQRAGFRKNRETRAPLIRELQPHRGELDPKFHYLLGAPEADPDGNPAVVRFSRKSGEQYVTSEVDGEAHGLERPLPERAVGGARRPQRGTAQAVRIQGPGREEGRVAAGAAAGRERRNVAGRNGNRT